MKFIHSADHHICHGMRQSQLPTELAEKHRNQLFDTFRKTAQLCKKENADLWLISGDLFESDYATAKDITSIYSIFRSIQDTRIFISCGNHDPFTADSYLNTIAPPKNVTIFPSELTQIKIEELNTVIWGFSWNKTRYKAMPFEFEQLDHSYRNILCLHCDALDASQYMHIERDILASPGFDYVALGHIHKFTNLGNNIAYPGSAEPLDFGESGRHGVIVGNFTEEGRELRFVKTSEKSFLTGSFDISNFTSPERIIDKIDQTLAGREKDFIRLKISGIRNEGIDIKQINRELSERYYYIDLRDETHDDIDIDSLYEHNKNNLIGLYIERLRETAKTDETASEALVLGLEALLDSNGGLKK